MSEQPKVASEELQQPFNKNIKEEPEVLEDEMEFSGEENLDVSSSSEEEDIEQDEEEEEQSSLKRKPKHQTREVKRKKSRFIEMEANVGGSDDDDDDSEDEDEDSSAYVDNEIEERETRESAAFKKTLASHAAKREEARLLAEERFAEAEQNPEAVEERLRALYGERPFGDGDKGTTTTINKAAATISWREAPTPQDPKLFLVKCRPGRERIAVFTACRALFHHHRNNSSNKKQVPIHSIFCKDSLKGFLYVEAHRSQDVINGLRELHMNHMIYASPLNPPSQVPLAEGAEVLFSTMVVSTNDSGTGTGTGNISRGSLYKKNNSFGKGSWVRIRRGKYAGDLALVLDDIFDGNDDNGNDGDDDDGDGGIGKDANDYYDSSTMLNIKLVPRLDYTTASRNANSAKPLQRPFSVEEATKASKINRSYLGKQGNFWIWGGERYSKEGMAGEPAHGGLLYKEVRLGAVYPLGMKKGSVIGGPGPAGVLAGVDEDPTEQEMAFFFSSDQSTISSFGDSRNNKDEGAQQYRMDEAVIVTKGELKGLRGRVKGSTKKKNAGGDGVEYLLHFADNEDLFGTELQSVPSSMLKKDLVIGELVTICAGDDSGFAGEKGMIVADASDGGSAADDVLVFLMDRNLQHTFHHSLLRKGGTINSNTNSTKVKATKTASQLAKLLSHTLAIYELVSIDRSASTSGTVPEVGLVRRVDVDAATVDVVGIDGLLHCGIEMSHITRIPRGDGAAGGRPQFRANDRVIGPGGESLLILQVLEDNAFLRPVFGGVNGVSGGVSGSDIVILPLAALKFPQALGAAPAAGAGRAERQSFLPPSVKGALGKSVTVGGPGPYKGLIGILRDVGVKNAKIELHTDSKVISVLNERVILTAGGERLIPSLSSSSAFSFGNDRPWASQGAAVNAPAHHSPSLGGSKTPAWGGRIGGQTPLVGSSGGGSRTPAWGSSSVSAGGSRTPAWGNLGNQTPQSGPTGSRTPAWGGIGAQTPVVGGAGNRTPSWGASAGGSKTPVNAGSRTPMGGNRTPSWGGPAGSKTPTAAASGNRTPSWGGTGSKTPTTTMETTEATETTATKPILNGVFKYSDKDGKECIGAIAEILSNQQAVTIKGQSIPLSSLISAVVPEKKDRVVLRDEEGVCGTIIGLDGPDAVIRVEGTADFKIVPLSNLVKIE